MLAQIKELFPEIEEDVIIKIIEESNYSIDSIVEQLKEEKKNYLENSETSNAKNEYNKLMIENKCQIIDENSISVEKKLEFNEIPILITKEKDDDQFSEQIDGLLKSGESQDLVREKWVYEFCNKAENLNDPNSVRNT